MKRKVLSVLVIIILLVLTFAILFLPGTYRNTEFTDVDAPFDRVQRSLSDPGKWKQWWPQEIKHMDYDSGNFKNTLEKLREFHIGIRSGEKSGFQKSELTIVNVNPVTLAWHIQISADKGLFSRIKFFFFSRKVKKEIHLVLQSLKTFVEDEDRYYGIRIREEDQNDSTLISLQKELDHFPTIAEIYELITQLQQYAIEEKAAATNHPMMHVQESEGKFFLMVALPLNRALPTKGKIQAKRMALGKILVAEVQGGNEVIKNGMREMDLYMEENKRTAPAIPFISLVTDRRQEPDSSKWKNRLVFPVY